MTLRDTFPMMCDDDYKERFKAEYYQVKIRLEKLRRFNARIDAAHQYPTKCEMPKHDCPSDVLYKQERIMGDYLDVLEMRAAIEGIEL